MAPKPIINNLFLGLSLAVFLFVTMIASEVAATDLVQSTPTATTSLPNSANEGENKNEIKDAKYLHDGYGGRYGGRGSGYPGGRYGGSGGSYGGYCRFGCCLRNYYGNGCRRCCAYKGEAIETDHPQTMPHY